MPPRNEEEAAIGRLLHTYEDALNASSTSAAVALYTSDGIFMPQHSPSAIGTEALQKAYDFVFNTITLSVKFTIQEVEVVAPEWAFARTNSEGKTKVNATGGGGPEANQELFVLKKVNGDWKIARYCFSTTRPPPGK
ncbi:hypothetical protein MMC25_007508 [Agyrium rufum]|nr:hypothetical protein [Agyrium rufum]